MNVDEVNVDVVKRGKGDKVIRQCGEVMQYTLHVCIHVMQQHDLPEARSTTTETNKDTKQKIPNTDTTQKDTTHKDTTQKDTKQPRQTKETRTTIPTGTIPVQHARRIGPSATVASARAVGIGRCTRGGVGFGF